MTRRLVLGLLGLIALGAAVVLGVARGHAVELIVAAPAPAYAPVAVPDGARAVEVERAGARIRAWVVDPAEAPPRATVLILHGIGDSKRSQLPTARRFAARGYRAVPVDLRGHGESSGAHLTYGVEEAADLSALVDQLAAEGLLAGPLGVLGSSYGAATAIQLGGRDARVRTVVALAPFASLREVVPPYARLILGPLADWLPGALVDHAVDAAGDRAHFDPDAACPRCAAPGVRGPMLLIHGTDDRRIPWPQSEAIRDAGHDVELRLVEGAGHGVGGEEGVSEVVDAWFDEHL